MNYVFCDKLDDFVTIYLDDILVFSPSIEEHEAHFALGFQSIAKTLC